MSRTAYCLWYYEIAAVPEAVKKKAAELLGGAEAVYGASASMLASCGILSEAEQDAILAAQKEDPISRYEALCENGIRFVSIEEAEYPKRLREIPQCPYGLYYSGSLPPEDRRSAAIVGARRCSAYGSSAAFELAYVLSKAGFTIISGMARGVDKSAHAGCLEGGGFTAAVLGCGVDLCYPPENRALYDRIRSDGAVLSEFYPGTDPIADNFPRRNRIISGLSDLVIVAEARIRSGSLITAKFAAQQNRTVLCVPGRINDPMSAGTNRLIDEGAGIITSPGDLLEKLGMEAGVTEHKRKRPELTGREKKVYECIDYYARSTESLLALTGLSFRDLLLTLAALSEKGLIRESYANTYERV